MATAELREIAEDQVAPEDPEGLYEIVDGQVVEKSMRAAEGRLASRLGRLLGNHTESAGLGETFVEVLFLTVAETGQKRRPDVAFLSGERWPTGREPEGLSYPLAPDLAVEVVSSSDRADDLQIKVLEYFSAAAKQVWVVYRTSATIVVHESASTARTLTRGDTLEGGRSSRASDSPFRTSWPSPHPRLLRPSRARRTRPEARRRVRPPRSD